MAHRGGRGGGGGGVGRGRGTPLPGAYDDDFRDDEGLDGFMMGALLGVGGGGRGRGRGGGAAAAKKPRVKGPEPDFRPPALTAARVAALRAGLLSLARHWSPARQWSLPALADDPFAPAPVPAPPDTGSPGGALSWREVLDTLLQQPSAWLRVVEEPGFVARANALLVARGAVRSPDEPPHPTALAAGDAKFAAEVDAAGGGTTLAAARLAVAAAQAKAATAAASAGGSGSASTSSAAAGDSAAAAAATTTWSAATHLTLMEMALPALLNAPTGLSTAASDAVWVGPAGVRRFYAMARQAVHYITRDGIDAGVGSWAGAGKTVGLRAHAAVDPTLRCTAVEGDPLWADLRGQLLNTWCDVAVGEGEPALDAAAIVADVPAAVSSCLPAIRAAPSLCGPGVPLNLDCLAAPDRAYPPPPGWVAASGGFLHPLGVLWPGDPEFEGEV